MTHRHGLVVTGKAVDDGEALGEASVAQDDDVADQLRHRDDHLQKTRSDQLDNILGDLHIISETLGSFGMQQSVSAVQL